MNKVLGLTVLANLWCNPAFAGQVFVFNQWTIEQDRTESRANIDRTTRANRTQEYNTSSNTTKIESNGFQRASSELGGTFKEENNTRIWGTIDTITNSYSSIHESSAGIR